MAYICVMSKESKSINAIPANVLKRLASVGNNIMIARKRRGFSQQHLADLVLVSRNTIRRLEKGDPGISFGILASTLWVLQLDTDLEMLAKPENDQLGLALSEPLKKRIRMKKKDDKYDF